jgi:hypothetical protein
MAPGAKRGISMKKTFPVICFLVAVLPGAVFPQSLDDKIGAAVKGLEQSLRYEVIVEAPLIQGTAAASPFSEYLRGLIRHYAVNSPAFTVLEGSRSVPQGIITGRYIETNGIVKVTLRLLAVPDIEKASTRFEVPAAELADLGIDWTTPQNIGTQEEAEEQYAAVTELENELTNTASLDFEARLNSDSGLYYDGDYMTVAVRAAQDCYMVIHHIDVNDVSQLIFPNRGDADNFLKKDETRTFFEGPTRLRLHEPFGQEHLFITVSTEQFDNLEAKMLDPVPAPGFNDALRQTRGATVEMLPVSKDLRYFTRGLSFSIWPLCRTDFEFADPAHALQETAEELRKNGGTFEGNDREGFFIVDGEKVDYRVQGGIITLITRLPPEAVPRSVTRSLNPPLQIDLSMPSSSIARQIAITGSKIRDTGGIFTGDENGGLFEVKNPVEITGNYQAAHENVTVLITKYPALFAGVIKSKIKEYFSE